MHTSKNWRPTPSFVISCMSLFVALSGSAIALQGQNSVKSDDIAQGAVHTGDVANHTLKSVDFAPGTLLQGPQGERGPEGPQGPPGPAGGGGGGGGVPSGPAGGALAGSYPNPDLATNAVPHDGTGTDGSTKLAVNSVNFQEIGPDAVRGSNIGNITTIRSTQAVPQGGVGIAEAKCPAGSQLLSGGGDAAGAVLRETYGSFPANSPGSWFASASASGPGGSVDAVAHCLS